MRIQFSSSVPNPGDDVVDVISTPSVCSWFSSVWPACGGMTTV